MTGTTILAMRRPEPDRRGPVIRWSSSVSSAGGCLGPGGGNRSGGRSRMGGRSSSQRSSRAGRSSFQRSSRNGSPSSSTPGPENTGAPSGAGLSWKACLSWGAGLSWGACLSWRACLSGGPGLVCGPGTCHGDAGGRSGGASCAAVPRGRGTGGGEAGERVCGTCGAAGCSHWMPASLQSWCERCHGERLWSREPRPPWVPASRVPGWPGRADWKPGRAWLETGAARVAMPRLGGAEEPERWPRCQRGGPGAIRLADGRGYRPGVRPGAGGCSRGLGGVGLRRSGGPGLRRRERLVRGGRPGAGRRLAGGDRGGCGGCGGVFGRGGPPRLAGTQEPSCRRRRSGP